jgi:hypothetical protein
LISFGFQSLKNKTRLLSGKGLPATSLEISFIERLRARREWEQDHTIDMTRTKIVIEREIREWQLREKEIKMYDS